MKRIVVFFIQMVVIGLLWSGCAIDRSFEPKVANPDFLHRAHHKLTDIIVYDIFSPPVASRIYAYASIAAYETIRQDYKDVPTLAGQLNELTPIPSPEDSCSSGICYGG